MALLQRRWRTSFRFSLRSLLIAVTLFSVWLGRTVDKARRQAQAADTIEQIGGVVYYDHQKLRFEDDGYLVNLMADSWAPKWLTNHVGIDLFATVEVVDFGFADVKDGDLATLKDLPDIQCLELGGSNLSRDAIPFLTRLRKLRFLGLEATDMDDADIARFRATLPHCKIKR